MRHDPQFMRSLKRCNIKKSGKELSLFLPFFERKQIAVHFGIGKDVGRRHADGFKAHGAAAIGEFILIGDIKKCSQEKQFIVVVAGSFSAILFHS